MSGRLQGRRVLVTHADRYIGPPVVELFRQQGAHVIADESDYTDPDAAREVVGQAGRLGSGTEAAELALSLSTEASDFLAGQVIPISGGWAT